MADNTVAEAVETLNNLPFASRETTICFGKPAMVIEHRKIDTDDAHAIAALIERQAAEIERLGKSEKTAEIKIAVAHEALVQIKGRSEIPKSEDDAHYENYFEAVSALKAVGDPEIELYDYLGMKSEVERLKQEIAKKDRMLDMVIKKLSLSDCPMDRSYDLACPKWTEDGAGCATCWLAWLEKEAEVHG